MGCLGTNDGAVCDPPQPHRPRKRMDQEAVDALTNDPKFKAAYARYWECWQHGIPVVLVVDDEEHRVT